MQLRLTRKVGSGRSGLSAGLAVGHLSSGPETVCLPSDGSCAVAARVPSSDGATTELFCSSSYLVDPASSHMLVSKIKPCMSLYKL